MCFSTYFLPTPFFASSRSVLTKAYGLVSSRPDLTHHPTILHRVARASPIYHRVPPRSITQKSLVVVMDGHSARRGGARAV